VCKIWNEYEKDEEAAGLGSLEIRPGYYVI
jgi:hypothetical protein